MTMLHRCVRLAAPVVLVVLVAGPALAAEHESRGAPGPYAGIGLIYAPSAFDLEDDLDASNPFGLDARVGYRVTRRVAVEGQYQFVPGFDVETHDATLATLCTHTLTANGKFYVLPEERLQPYAVGGIGLLHVSGRARGPTESVGDDTAFAGRVGVGADFYALPDVVLNLEFSAVLPTHPVDELRFLPLVFGVQYRF